MNDRAIRFTGLAGLAGGLLLFSGDMLLYYDPVSTDLLRNMSHVAVWRLRLSTLFALLAAWAYLAGAVQMYLAFRPAPVWVRRPVTAFFAAILVAYGVIHAHYMAIALTARLAVLHGLDPVEATRLARDHNHLLRLVVYPLFALLSILFLYAVWKRRTLYPRWIIFFFPLFPFFLQGPLDRLLSGPLHTVIVGGFFNLLLVLFFGASTFALWHPREAASSPEIDGDG